MRRRILIPGLQNYFHRNDFENQRTVNTWRLYWIVYVWL